MWRPSTTRVQTFYKIAELLTPLIYPPNRRGVIRWLPPQAATPQPPLSFQVPGRIIVWMNPNPYQGVEMFRTCCPCWPCFCHSQHAGAPPPCARAAHSTTSRSAVARRALSHGRSRRAGLDWLRLRPARLQPDCSGFTSPRTESQAGLGPSGGTLTPAAARDLVFKRPAGSSTTSGPHGAGEFIHASIQGRIRLAPRQRLLEQSRYWQARRLIQAIPTEKAPGAFHVVNPVWCLRCQRGEVARLPRGSAGQQGPLDDAIMTRQRQGYLLVEQAAGFFSWPPGAACGEILLLLMLQRQPGQTHRCWKLSGMRAITSSSRAQQASAIPWSCAVLPPSWGITPYWIDNQSDASKLGPDTVPRTRALPTGIHPLSL